MATHRLNPAFIRESAKTEENFISKLNAFADGQKAYAGLWWIAALMVNGFLVPITFLMVYSLNGPVMVFLGISMVSFFVNFIANMGGAGIRFCLNSFFFTILVHLLMVISTLLFY